jgi:hypothetical protein
MTPPKDVKSTVPESDMFGICRYSEFIPTGYITQQAETVLSAENRDVTGDGKAEYVVKYKVQTWQCPGTYKETVFQRIKRFGDSNVFINTSRGQKIDEFDVVTYGGNKYYVFKIPEQIIEAKAGPDQLRVVLIPVEDVPKAKALLDEITRLSKEGAAAKKDKDKAAIAEKIAKKSQELSELLSKNIKVVKAGELTEDAKASADATETADLPTMIRLAQIPSFMVGLLTQMDIAAVSETTRDVTKGEKITVNIAAKDLQKACQAGNADERVGRLTQGYEIKNKDVTGDGEPELILDKREVVWSCDGVKETTVQQILKLGDDSATSKETTVKPGDDSSSSDGVVLKTSKYEFKYYDQVVITENGERGYLFTIPLQGVANRELNPDNLIVIMIPENTMTKVLGLIVRNNEIQAKAKQLGREPSADEVLIMKKNGEAIVAALTNDAIAVPAGKLNPGGLPLKDKEKHVKVLTLIREDPNQLVLATQITAVALSKFKE